LTPGIHCSPGRGIEDGGIMPECNAGWGKCQIDDEVRNKSIGEKGAPVCAKMFVSVFDEACQIPNIDKHRKI